MKHLKPKDIHISFKHSPKIDLYKVTNIIYFIICAFTMIPCSWIIITSLDKITINAFEVSQLH